MDLGEEARPSTARPAPRAADVPPTRPRRLDRAQLGFEPQSAVRWFSPGVMAGSALHVGLTSVLGQFLDKRELQVSKPCEPDRRYAGRDDLWVDYVADTGDGFEATATVATRVARRLLTVEGLDHPLPRGEVLVLGGDEVYPAASSEAYENRLVGPWRAALPWTGGESPTVYAIPGNHDWFDGLTGFLRLFGQGQWLGGWRTRQTRSYFAVELPQRWWLWGVDIESDSLIDEPQLDFFAAVAAEAGPGSKLVLATAVPSWILLRRQPSAYHNLAFIERTLLRPAGIDLRLTIAGDNHHYSRYEHQGPDEQTGPTHKITAGGGGAFLHPTHVLPSVADVRVSGDQPGDEEARYVLKSAYPSRARSHLLSGRAVALAWRNPSFTVVPGLVALSLLWTVQFGLRSLEPSDVSFAEAGATWGWQDVAGGLVRNSAAGLSVLIVFLGLFAFARTPQWAARGGRRVAVRLGMALLHLALQAVGLVFALSAALTVARQVSDRWFPVVASGVAFALGGIVGATLVGVYLTLAIAIPGLGAHANESFAASRITGYKNFLRMHVDAGGALTVYAIGIDRAVKRRHWRAVPEAADPETAWIAPARGDPGARLIDRITVR
jgi:hypothetical protein